LIPGVGCSDPWLQAPQGVEAPAKECSRPLRLLGKVVSAKEPVNTTPFVVFKAFVLVVAPLAVAVGREWANLDSKWEVGILVSTFDLLGNPIDGWWLF